MSPIHLARLPLLQGKTIQGSFGQRYWLKIFIYQRRHESDAYLHGTFLSIIARAGPNHKLIEQ